MKLEKWLIIGLGIAFSITGAITQNLFFIGGAFVGLGASLILLVGEFFDMIELEKIKQEFRSKNGSD